MADRKRTAVEDDFGKGGKLHDFEEGDLIAVYEGTRADVKTKFGVKNIHDFKLESGEDVSVFGRAMLDRLLAKVEPGTLVEIVETGKTQRTNSGGKVKVFEVYTLEK